MYELTLARSTPTADVLDRIVKQYPQYAKELTDFAIELALDAMQHDENDEAMEDTDTVSPAVSRVMSRVQNELFFIRQADADDNTSRAAIEIVQNPFASFDRNGFRTLASGSNANTALLSKLRDRQIDPDTIPEGFCTELAARMGLSPALLLAHFRAPPTMQPAGQFFKASGKPSTRPQQSFEDAVRQSGLTQDQQKRLLAFND
jgi:hypothetical protein